MTAFRKKIEAVETALNDLQQYIERRHKSNGVIEGLIENFTNELFNRILQEYLDEINETANDYRERKMTSVNSEIQSYWESELNSIKSRLKQIEREQQNKMKKRLKKNKEKMRENAKGYYDNVRHRWSNNLIEIARDVANEYGGKCLTDKCNNQKNLITWECSRGHIFERSLDKVINRTKVFCKDCTQTHPSENITRLIFECIFNKQFPTAYPEWLVYPQTDAVMELDGYCEELKIAFEYDGPHHSTLIHNNSVEDLIKQQEKDEFKKQRCTEMGVVLININYKIDRIKLKDHIINEVFYLHTKGYITIPNYVQGNIYFNDEKYKMGLRQIRSMMVNYEEFNDLWTYNNLPTFRRV